MLQLLFALFGNSKQKSIQATRLATEAIKSAVQSGNRLDLADAIAKAAEAIR